MSRRRDSDQSSVARLGITPGQLRAIEGLELGRRKAIEQAKLRAAKNAALVMNLAMIDLDAGRPVRGRAGRIARKLEGLLTERSVKRILVKFSVCPIQAVQNEPQNKEGSYAK